MKNISNKDTFEKREEKKLFIETYGCQMNVADSEVVASIMQMAGYTLCDTIEDSDAIFVNTCSIRDNAEQKVLSRLSYFQSLRKHKKSLWSVPIRISIYLTWSELPNGEKKP